jgi:hypothetical protein
MKKIHNPDWTEIDHSKFSNLQVTRLLTELVTLPEVKPNQHKTFDVIPPIIRNFAEGSRVEDGNRLCQRTLRHATDPRHTDIRLCNGYVIEEEDQDKDNNIGLVLKHNIKASMKNDTYKVELAFTCNDMISCSCTCRCGSIGIEKVLCVHILPVLFQIGQLMFMGMSEHILVESSNYFCATYTHEEETNEQLLLPL